MHSSRRICSQCCMNTPHFISRCWWSFGLLTLWGYYEQCCYEHFYTFLYVFSELVCTFKFRIYPGERLIGHRVCVCSALVDNIEEFSKVDYESSSCSISSAKFSIVFLFWSAVLMTIPLVNNRAEHLAMFIVDLNIIFWEFKNLFIFLLGWVVWLLKNWFQKVVCIFWIQVRFIY